MAEADPSLEVHLILGAGGIRCLSYAGAIRALAQRGYSFASVSGVSAGAFVGALVSAGKTPEELEDIVRTITLSSLAGTLAHPILGFRQILGWPFSKYRNSGLTADFCRRVGGDPTFAELKIPFATIGLDVINRALLIYDRETNPTMKVSEALSIATAAPFLYPPHEREGRILIDAGVVSDCPVWLQAAHPKRLSVVALSTTSQSSLERPSDFGAFLSGVIESSVDARDDSLAQGMPHVKRIQIQCGTLQADAFSISLEQRVSLMEQGRKAVEQGLEGGLRSPSTKTRPRPAADRTADDRAASQYERVAHHYYIQAKEVIMGDQIKAGNRSILNVRSTVQGAIQAIESSNLTLTAPEKDEFKRLAEQFEKQLEAMKKTHAEEAELLGRRFAESIALLEIPKEKRKKGIFDVTARGLVDAAKAVGEAMPEILASAGAIAAFVMRLV